MIDKGVLFPQFESVELNVWQEKGVYGAMVHCYLDDIETIHDVAFTEREFYADITLGE